MAAKQRKSVYPMGLGLAIAQVRESLGKAEKLIAVNEPDTSKVTDLIIEQMVASDIIREWWRRNYVHKARANESQRQRTR